MRQRDPIICKVPSLREMEIGLLPLLREVADAAVELHLYEDFGGNRPHTPATFDAVRLRLYNAVIAYQTWQAAPIQPASKVHDDTCPHAAARQEEQPK